MLLRALEVLTSWDIACDAWVFSGDLSDDGSPESYRFLREHVADAAARVGVRVIWGSGNHDDRPMLRAELLDAPGVGPVDTETDLAGLRVLTVESSVPGVPWGVLGEDTLAWLADRLASPAPLGTLLVVHHPPIPVPQPAANLLWPLTNPEALARLLRGTDVRAILSGHVHQASFGTLAGVPVATAPALAYTQDLTAGRTQRGQDAHQGFSLVEVFADAVVTTVVPLEGARGVHRPVTAAQARAAVATHGPPVSGSARP